MSIEQNTIESREFYELMQSYRHCPLFPMTGPSQAYQAVIEFANAYAERRVQESLAVRNTEK